MPAAGFASSNLRTYGKKSAIKRKQTKDLLDADNVSTTPGTTAKRRKLSPESRTRTPSPTSMEGNIDKDYKGHLHENRKNVSIHGSLPVGSSIQRSPSRKLGRDLSFIFDDIASKPPSASPSKLAKRMLSRSKTESSIDSAASSQVNTIDRTPSLPVLPSTPSRGLKDKAFTENLATPLLPRLSQSSNKSNTRTYAGKFRSFLVSLPKSYVPNDTLPTNMDDEGFENRESYSSLRSRWGVDDSEDDPYPTFSPSPSKSNKSNVTTPDMSPSRNGKGKGKVATLRHAPVPSGMSNPLKSISELRNRGESRRFLDEVGYLFEGMNPSGRIGLRRASALEITTKLCDADFARKAKAADFFNQTWNIFLDTGAGSGEDKILDILLVFFVSLVARDPSSLSDLARMPSESPSLSSTPLTDKNDDVIQRDLSLVDILFRLLASITPDVDPLLLVASEESASDAEFKKAGINNKDRPFLITVYRTISYRTDIFPPGSLISTSLLISYILQSLPPSVISVEHFPTFLDSLRLTLSFHSQSSLFSNLSDKWRDAIFVVTYNNIYYHLSLLDTYILNQWAPPCSTNEDQFRTIQQEGMQCKERNDAVLDRARDNWLVKDLIALCVCLHLGAQSSDLDPSILQQCLSTVLRVLVSLTHEDALWGRQVTQCEYTMGWLLRLIYKTGQEVLHNRIQAKAEGEVKTEEAEEAPSPDSDDVTHTQDSYALDTLCLALGLLTNLVQTVEEVNLLLRNIRLNPSCSLERQDCAIKCNCTQVLSGFEILTQLYSQLQIKIETPLLSLSADSPEARAEADASFLRSHLAILFGLLMQGKLENRVAILSALPSDLYTKNSNAVRRSKLSRLVDQAKDFASFYAAVGRNLGGDKESKVAKDVVSFLEIQRDSIV